MTALEKNTCQFVAHTMSKQEQYALIRQAQSGNIAARNQLIELNMRLVCHFANRAKTQVNQEDQTDLVQEGVLGLIKAIEKFDCGKDIAFSTYAVPWVSQGILRAIPRYLNSMVLPDRAMQEQRRLRKALEQEPDASNEQLARMTGLTLEQTACLLRWQRLPLYLSMPLCDDAEETYGSMLADVAEDTSEYPQRVAEHDEQCELVQQYLSVLSAKERRVLEMYYGLNGYPEEGMSSLQIGKEMGFSRQMTCLYHAQAMKKIRKWIAGEVAA